MLLVETHRMFTQNHAEKNFTCPNTCNLIPAFILLASTNNNNNNNNNNKNNLLKKNTAQVIPIVISSTGVIPKSLSQSLKRLDLHPNTYIQMQKSVILGTCSIVRNFLIYRVIHKSLRDFRTRLRNNQDRHGRKEHINM